MAPAPGYLSMRSCCSFSLLLLVLKTSWASKLNVPRVLLPYNPSPPSFSLSSEAGCYSWSTTRPDILRLTLEDSECSGSAVSSHLAGCFSGFLLTLLAGDSGSGDLRREDQCHDHGGGQSNRAPVEGRHYH